MSRKRSGKILPHALKSMIQKPATVSSATGSAEAFADVRGKLVFETAKCVGCKLCVRDCPAKAIEIQKIADKEFKAVLLLDRCIFCGQCVESCNKDALRCTSEFELAGLSRADMTIDI